MYFQLSLENSNLDVFSCVLFRNYRQWNGLVIVSRGAVAPLCENNLFCKLLLSKRARIIAHKEDAIFFFFRLQNPSRISHIRSDTPTTSRERSSFENVTLHELFAISSVNPADEIPKTAGFSRNYKVNPRETTAQRQIHGQKTPGRRSGE